MPIYEYACKKCGAHFEKRQSVSDDPLKTCESCGGELQKQWSLSGFQFKGAGWYVTDYAKKNGAGAEVNEKAEKSSNTESTGTADSASNKKAPEPKPDGPAKKT
jgi:putative FmdB family regulatory protein